MTVLPLVALLSCNGPTPEPEPSPLLGVENSQMWTLPGLETRGYVIYTEMGIPHIYASNVNDQARILGFTIARDRFFFLDLARRLSTGEVSMVFGDLALENDLESRGISMARIAELVEADFTPEQREYAQAYAEGVNAYIAAVKAGTLPAPSEYEFFYLLLGHETVGDALLDFSAKDVAAIIASIMFRLGFDTGDASRARHYQALLDDTLFVGKDLETLRTDGRWDDVWNGVAPTNLISSADGWGESGTKPRGTGDLRLEKLPRIAPDVLERAKAKDARISKRLHRDQESGWGSNSWAVAGTHSTDGRGLLAADGHLELDVPGLMYQLHMDTEHLGGPGGQNLYGDLIAGAPMLGTGTNGKAAWGFTQLMGDVTDVYAEQIQLDADGKPSAAMYLDDWVPLVQVDEEYVIREVPALESVGRTEVWPRWETADGRFLYEIEGRSASRDEELAAGETLVNMAGDWIVPGDTDGDGVITALTFDFTALDGGSLYGMLWDRLDAQDVVDVAETTKKGQALSLNTVAADANGDIFYTGYQITPCRSYLDKNADGSWAEGSDPTMLIDGNRYLGFTVPLTENLAADESMGEADPYKCVVPWQEYPHSYTPEKGYLLSANNDPGGITFDNDLNNEPWYIAGPWMEAFRADAIDRRLAAATTGGFADREEMSDMHSHTQSLIGRQFSPHLVAAIQHAKDLSAQDFDPPVGSSDERLLAMYNARASEYDEVHTRLSAWADNDFWAHSGVETFYNPDVTDDMKANAVATMIWNTFMGDLYRESINDEGFRGFRPTGGSGRTRIIKLMLNNRGNNDDGLSSYNDVTGESAFWDHLDTPSVIEESDEIMLTALGKALDFLMSDGNGEGEDGFGTTDMDQWLWGLRHQAEFRSIVGGYIDDPALSPILNGFSITTGRIPLADNLSGDDPRRELDWFPMDGDNLGVNGCNSGSSGRRFRCGAGGVMRQSFALGPDGVEGVDILPGGQSGLSESANYDDQIRLWLADEALPIHYKVEDVVANAQRRETFKP